MIKLTKYYNKLQSLLDDICETMDTIEEKKNAIEEHACDMDRDLTEKEQERFDELDEELSAVDDFREQLYLAMETIEDYSDKDF